MARRAEGFFSAADNLRLYYESLIPDSPKAHVAVVHGYREHLGRWRWVMQQLADKGFAAHAFDYRGHGRADGKRAHCERFPQYVSDLDVFWSRVTGQAEGKKTFLLGHSHGGLISAMWAASRHKQEGVAGIVLSAPYLRLAFKPPRLKVLASRLIGQVIPWMPVPQALIAEELTRDPEAQKRVMEDPLYIHTVTPRWFTESTKAQLEVLKSGPSIEAPVFAFTGSKDPVASPLAVRAFFETLGSRDKKFREYPDRVHEPLNDLGKEEVMNDVCAWLGSHL